MANPSLGERFYTLNVTRLVNHHGEPVRPGGTKPAREEHYFRVIKAGHEICGEDDVKVLLDDLRVRFPEGEGFRVTADRWVGGGESLAWWGETGHRPGPRLFCRADEPKEERNGE